MSTLRTALFTLLLCTCTAQPTPPNTVAPDPPTFQRATPAGSGTKVSWRSAQTTDSDWELTLVVRYEGRPDGKPPSKVPAVGDAFGSGVVVYVGPDSSFTDAVLPKDCGTFTYQLWSRDVAGHWSGGGVSVTTLPGGLAPPAAAPTALSVTRSGMRVFINWMPAPGAATTRVVRNLGTPALNSEQGTRIYDGDEFGTSEAIAVLPVGQTLFYSAFACNSCGACSMSGATATMIVEREDAGLPDAGKDDPDAGSPLQPRNMQATLSSNGLNVNLSWVNPASSTGFTQVKVLRQLNALPNGPDDPSAARIFVGASESATEAIDKLLPNVSPGGTRVYYYTAFGCANATCETRGSRTTFQLTVSQALHGGGYTIWWRHASASTCGDRTDFGACSCSNGNCTNCPSNNWWKSCDTNCATSPARQLTPPQSTLETTTIHDQFAAKGITVSRVLSSEMCRGIQTAQGLNFGPTIELLKELTYFVYDEANRCSSNYDLLNEPPLPGTVTAMVGHAGNTCNVLASLAWAEAAVFKPNPGGMPTFIVQVPYNSWANLP